MVLVTVSSVVIAVQQSVSCQRRCQHQSHHRFLTNLRGKPAVWFSREIFKKQPVSTVGAVPLHVHRFLHSRRGTAPYAVLWGCAPLLPSVGLCPTVYTKGLCPFSRSCTCRGTAPTVLMTWQNQKPRENQNCWFSTGFWFSC